MSTKNIFNKEAKEKIKELAESIDFTMMATNLKAQPFHVIPMSTKKVDEQGGIWFLSNKNSDHNQHIVAEKKAQLIYSNPSSMEFLTIYGNATILTDKNILEDLYGSSDDAWFEGVDDPNLTAICIHPDKGHYWDTKSGKFISLLKIGLGAVTGSQPDLGQQGDLKI